MIAGRLIEMLQRYPEDTEIFISLGRVDPELRTLVGVREGHILEHASPIRNDTKRTVNMSPLVTQHPVIAAILMA